jgi:hypothetical protein
MRKGYLFIRTRTRHIGMKALLVALGLVAVVAAAVPGTATSTNDRSPERHAWSSQDVSETPRADDPFRRADMDCTDFDNQAEARAYFETAGKVAVCEKLP